MSLSPRVRYVYTVTRTHHYDCYKRAESYSDVVGLYDDAETAYQVATVGHTGSMMDYIDNMKFPLKRGESMLFSEILQAISECKTWEDSWKVWEKVDAPWGEFTAQRTGDYYSVTKERIKSADVTETVSEWFQQANQEYQDYVKANEED